MFPTSGLQNSKIISGIKKIKKTEPFVFLIFLILKTLISRIKKIKKTEPLIFVIFLILEIIFGILEGQKLETIIFWFFFIFFNSRNSNVQNEKK